MIVDKSLSERFLITAKLDHHREISSRRCASPGRSAEHHRLRQGRRTRTTRLIDCATLADRSGTDHRAAGSAATQSRVTANALTSGSHRCLHRLALAPCPKVGCRGVTGPGPSSALDGSGGEATAADARTRLPVASMTRYSVVGSGSLGRDGRCGVLAGQGGCQRRSAVAWLGLKRAELRSCVDKALTSTALHEVPHISLKGSGSGRFRHRPLRRSNHLAQEPISGSSELIAVGGGDPSRRRRIQVGTSADNLTMTPRNSLIAWYAMTKATTRATVGSNQKLPRSRG